jgi:hypothetical protein
LTLDKETLDKDFNELIEMAEEINKGWQRAIMGDEFMRWMYGNEEEEKRKK